jgi:flagellar protein FlbT
VTSYLKVHLKPNERMYINGGVIRVDRKVTLELMNDVVFLLEGHVLQEEQATTPLRQLYFIVQSMLMEPRNQPMARALYEQSHQALLVTFKNMDVIEGLLEVQDLMARGRTFESLRKIRSLFPLERDILGSEDPVAGDLSGATAKKSVA